MPEQHEDAEAHGLQPAAMGNAPIISSEIVQTSRILFFISRVALIALIAMIFLPFVILAITGNYIPVSFGIPPSFTERLGPLPYVLVVYLPHIVLFLLAAISAYIGYKLVVASGASPENPIPPGNYALLEPLISAGKTDAIDQYVRLSSLSGFTGTFTKLGLTGLPLATIALTLIFAGLAIAAPDDLRDSFMDLTKLVLGAFIGSFVQRQVEQRRDLTGVRGARDQARPPAGTS